MHVVRRREAGETEDRDGQVHEADQTIVDVARSESFSATARKRGLSRAQVSKSVAAEQDPVNGATGAFSIPGAWMVYTDMVSHACLSGQYCFVHTSLVRLENCHLPELAPINILRNAAQSG